MTEFKFDDLVVPVATIHLNDVKGATRMATLLLKGGVVYGIELFSSEWLMHGISDGAWRFCDYGSCDSSCPACGLIDIIRRVMVTTEIRVTCEDMTTLYNDAWKMGKSIAHVNSHVDKHGRSFSCIINSEYVEFFEPRKQ